MPVTGSLALNKLRDISHVYQLVSPIHLRQNKLILFFGDHSMTSIRLAPLCGVTDHIFRTLCFEQGCDQSCTEMISAMGYICAPNQRAVTDLMKRGDREKKLILQLFGKDADTIAEAAKRICDLGVYDGIDINMGCPARKVACSGEGSGLMKDPENARRIMEKTVKASSLPVSVKMRSGWDSEHINVIDLAQMAEDAGISEVTVHGRTREQQYGGTADWDLIENVKLRIHIPVIGNGDIFTAEDAMNRIRTTNVDGIMIGRGALGNPWLFRQIKQMLETGKASSVSIQERHDMIHRHYNLMLNDRPEHIATREMRKHIGWYMHGLRGSARIRDEINRCPDPEKVLSVVDRFFEEKQEDDTGDQLL